MNVDLKAVLKARGRKRALTLRPIVTTKAQANELAALYAPILDIWAKGAAGPILTAYGRSLAEFTGDSPADIEATIESVDESAVRAIIEFRSLFQGWANKVTMWHVRKLSSQLTYATNVDLVTPLGGARGTVEDMLARNVALIRNVSDETRGRIADIVFRGLQNRTPIRDIGKEIDQAVGLGKARSLRIASDQTVKLSAALDELRQRQLGFESFIWRHSGKTHYRPEHKARDGKVFSWESDVAKTDPPGYAPFCGCKALAHMDMDEENAPEPEAPIAPPVRAPVAAIPAPAPVRAPRAPRTPRAPRETVAARTARLNQEARDYVITNGKRDNWEYLSAFDKATGEVIDQYTSKGERFVEFSPAVLRAISDPKRKIVIRHNHPSSTSLSGQDALMMSEFPGMAEMVADGIDGSYYYATRGRKKLTKKAVDAAQTRARDALQQAVNARVVTPADAGKIEAHIRNLALHEGGFIKYDYRFEGGTSEIIERNRSAIERIHRWLKS